MLECGTAASPLLGKCNHACNASRSLSLLSGAYLHLASSQGLQSSSSVRLLWQQESAVVAGGLSTNPYGHVMSFTV